MTSVFNWLAKQLSTDPALRVRDKALYGEQIARHCGLLPVLRVRGTYVQYECRKCGARGGLAITEKEASELWNEL